MESKIMEKYYAYMRDNQNLKVGTYEAVKLANICNINVNTLVFLGARANAAQSPIAIKEGWYIYMLEERLTKNGAVYYITIDNELKYL